MAQFIQANQLTPVQGSAGQQPVVQNQGPTLGEGIGNVTQQVGNMIDTAGTIYGTNRAQSLVDEEIQNIDRAVATAESGRFTAGDDIPESLRLDQKEWDMLATAVQSGTMSREKARLIASSRLRSRIAEEPFFADRMRKAASGVLGFNIESEAAQQYFASFKTAGQLAEGGNDYRSKKLEEANAYVEAGVAESVDEAYKFLVRVDASANKKELAASQFELGSMNAQDFTTEFLQANQSSAWGTLLGEVKAFEQANDGQPIDGVAFSRIIDERKAGVVEDFNSKWVEAGGQLNTPEYNRAKESINNQYTEMKEFVDSYGVDNLTKIQIERQEQARELYGDQFFPAMKLVTDTFGQQVTSDLISMMSLNATQRDLILSQNPELKTAYELLNSNPREFNKKMSDTATKILNGQELTDDDAPYVDYVTKKLHNEGSQESKGSIIQGLADSNMPWKAMSMLSETSPRLEPEGNRETYKTQYNQSIEPLLDQLSEEIATTPGLTWNVDDDGMVTVRQDSAQGALPSTAPGGLVTNPQEVQQSIVQFNRANQLAEKLNLFAKGHKKGWSRVVGESLDQYKTRIKSLTSQMVTDKQDSFVEEGSERMTGLLESGDVEQAREIFEQIKRFDPDSVEQTFEEILEQARRLREQGGQ